MCVEEGRILLGKGQVGEVTPAPADPDLVFMRTRTPTGLRENFASL